VACYLAHIGRNAAHWAQLRGPLLELRRKHADLPFAAVMLSDEPLRRDLEANGFAVFEDPTRAIDALRVSVPSHVEKPEGGRLPAPVNFPPPPLSERQAKRILAAAGIPFLREKAVQSAEQAAEAAHEIGFPVVAKILSADIPHKSEIGGVIVGLATPGAVADAYATLMRRARERAPKARIEGVLIARMVSGVETLIGLHADPVFGPVITFGAGGVLTELLKDTALALAPVSVERAAAMIQETRIAKLLGGYRGTKACDLQALAECISALSRFAAANAGRVAGIDLNPVVCTPEGAWALDALIELKEAS
jgi:acyl-CoA synthetase (NDP forming)